MNAMPETSSGMPVCQFRSRLRLELQEIMLISIAADTYRIADMSASLAEYQACAFVLSSAQYSNNYQEDH